ncbi:MAG: winged helix-turn-helix domain-containing protein [Candidatus Omnitrophota bacterium]
MITKIGICAGQVLLCLETHQRQMPVNVLLREIDASSELILMAVGWLARESYVHIHGAAPMSGTISLKKDPPHGGE